jgi:hypothetical protein
MLMSSAFVSSGYGTPSNMLCALSAMRLLDLSKTAYYEHACSTNRQYMQYNRKAALKEDHSPHYGNNTHYGMTTTTGSVQNHGAWKALSSKSLKQQEKHKCCCMLIVHCARKQNAS